MEDNTSHVGIFWYLSTTTGLLVDSVPLADAERYGDFLNYGGHYEYWTKLAALDAMTLRKHGLPETVRASEYDDWPRGRIVYQQSTRKFILYADRKLHTKTIIAEIVQRFALPVDRTVVRSDSHYRMATK